MKKIPFRSQNPKGLHRRYYIEKVDPDGIPMRCDENAEYFVLRLDKAGRDSEHVKAGRIGVHAYADAIAHHLPQLAADLKERYPLL
jgi:hypothetical protein